MTIEEAKVILLKEIEVYKYRHWKKRKPISKQHFISILKQIKYIK